MNFNIECHDLFSIDHKSEVISQKVKPSAHILVLLRLKPGLHRVVKIAEHVCDDASKRILKLSKYRLQLFLVKDRYL